VLHTVKETSILRTINRKKRVVIGHKLHTNCLLRQVIEGGTGGRIKGREDKDKDDSSYWMILGNERILKTGRGSTVWRNRLEEAMDLT